MSQFKLVALAAVFAASAASQAATVSLTVDYAGANLPTTIGLAEILNTVEDKDFTPTPAANDQDNITAGLLNPKGAGQSFYAFCIQPDVALFKTPSQSYDDAAALGFTAPNATLAVQQLYGNYFSLLVDPSTGQLVATATKEDAVAFQIALWELALDDGKLYDAAGKLQFLSAPGSYDADRQGFLDRAAQMIAGTGVKAAFTTEYTFKRYELRDTPIGNGNFRGQDLLRATAVTAVPEPGTYALMIGGLAALGFAARRRKQA